MIWKEATRLDQVFGQREKIFRLTGRQRLYDQFLTPTEAQNLLIITRFFQAAAEIENSVLHGLLVGSAAATLDHIDSDLLFCSEPKEKRFDVAERGCALMRISGGYDMNTRHARSAENFARDFFLSFKIVARTLSGNNLFDISFVGKESGSWLDVLDFHARTNLAHCVVL